MKEKAMLQHAAAIHHRELLATTGVKLCGFTAALLPFCIGLFLFMRGSETFLVFGHSLQEFLFSGQWAPSDTASGGGQVGLPCLSRAPLSSASWPFYLPFQSVLRRPFI